VLIGWVNPVGPPERAGSPNRSGASSTLIGWVTLSGRLSGPAGCAKASLRYAEHRAGRRQGPRAPVDRPCGTGR
jgi:hypothetical protein